MVRTERAHDQSFLCWWQSGALLGSSPGIGLRVKWLTVNDETCAQTHRVSKGRLQTLRSPRPHVTARQIPLNAP